MFYKTNEEILGITVTEFVDEWYEKQDYILVDIRDTEERKSAGVVKQTFNISMYEIPDQIEMAPTYIVCLILCQDSTKSEQVTKYLKNNGYKNMLYIKGGIDELIQAVPELKG